MFATNNDKETNLGHYLEMGFLPHGHIKLRKHCGTHDLIEGSYIPRFLKRHYFPEEMIDQLHLSDRVLQHILLQQLKPTFASIGSFPIYEDIQSRIFYFFNQLSQFAIFYRHML